MKYIWELEIGEDFPPHPIEFETDGGPQKAAEIGAQYGPGKLREPAGSRVVVVRHPDEMVDK